MTLYFKQLEVGPMANYVYLFGCTTSKETVVVDPAWDIPALLAQAEKDERDITHVLVSHIHPDHVGGTLGSYKIPGVAQLLEEVSAKVWVHKTEAPHLDLPHSEKMPTDAHTQITLGEVDIEFLHTPGHTPGSQCFKLKDRLISGDTLFIGSCGRVDFPGSNPEDMYESLTQKLMKLPDDTLVYPGHNYANGQTHSNIGKEKTNNPYFRFPNKKTFLSAMGY